MQRHAFWVPASWGLEEWPKEQISLNLNYKVNFKDFKENFVCLLKMKHIKHIRFDFIRSPGSCPRVEIWGIPYDQIGDLGLVGPKGQIPLDSSRAWGFAMRNKHQA